MSESDSESSSPALTYGGTLKSALDLLRAHRGALFAAAWPLALVSASASAFAMWAGPGEEKLSGGRRAST